jgi:hypothetical protein
LHSCRVYGLDVHVNVPIAALAGLPPAHGHDVSLSIEPHRGGEADLGGWHELHASDERDACGVPNIRVSRRTQPERFRFDYEDGTRIEVDGTGSCVWARSAAGATVEDTATYLLGPTLGFVLQLRGFNCLHASVVALGDSAVAFAGASGFGKSSLAAAMALRDHPVLADDLCALVERSGRFFVRPAYPRIRLWPHSVDALFGHADAMPRITPTWDKRFVPLDGAPYRFQSEELPLSRVYLIADRDLPGGPRIGTVGARDALVRLVGNSYTAKLLDKAARAREFETLARLIQSVPVREAQPADDFARLDELCEAIEADV